MPTVTLARHAMATRFEVVLQGEDPVSLRAAGEAALDEIERLEAKLSLFRPTSEVARVNALAAREAVRISPQLFRLLEQASRLTQETRGAFDITIAPLMRCWGFREGGGAMPSPEAIAEAIARVGMHLVKLDPLDFTVRFAKEGVMLDLGAIGKGYAVEQAGEILREAGVSRALIHGGTSTVQALGSPDDGDSWKIAIERPGQGSLLAVIPLRDESLSVSAVSGRCFQSGQQTFGHVMDPRTGHPVSHAVMAGVVAGSATETDALSTALLAVGIGGQEEIAGLRANSRSFVVGQDGQISGKGLALRAGAGQS